MLLFTNLKFSGKQERVTESKVKDAQGRAVLLKILNGFSAAQLYFTEILFHEKGFHLYCGQQDLSSTCTDSNRKTSYSCGKT